MKRAIKKSKSFKAMLKLAEELDIAQVSGPPEDYTETTWKDVVDATVNPGSPAPEPTDEVGKAASRNKESMKAVTAKAKLAFALTSGLLDEEKVGKDAFEDTVVDFMSMDKDALTETVKRLSEIGVLAAEETPKAKDPEEVRKELEKDPDVDADDTDDINEDEKDQGVKASKGKKKKQQDDEDEDDFIATLLNMEDDEEDTDIKEAGKKKKQQDDEDKEDEKESDEDEDDDKDEDEKKEEEKEEEDKKETGKKKKNHQAKLASVLNKIAKEKKASSDETLEGNFWGNE